MAETLRVRMMTMASGPDFQARPGEELDLPRARAEALLDGGYAQRVSAPESAVDVPPPHAEENDPESRMTNASPGEAETVNATPAAPETATAAPQRSSQPTSSSLASAPPEARWSTGKWY